MRNKKLYTMVYMALLTALMLVMKLTGIGLINLGIVNVTVYCTIITIATLSLGLYNGMLLGAVFAALSFWDALNARTGLVVPLMAASPVYVFIMSFVPRLLVSVVAHFVNRAICRFFRNDKVGLAAGAAAGSLCNTILYLGIMLIGYYMFVADNAGILITIGTIALSAGLPEALFAAVVTTPVVLALRKTYR